MMSSLAVCSEFQSSSNKVSSSTLHSCFLHCFGICHLEGHMDSACLVHLQHQYFYCINCMTSVHNPMKISVNSKHNFNEQRLKLVAKRKSIQRKFADTTKPREFSK